MCFLVRLTCKIEVQRIVLILTMTNDQSRGGTTPERCSPDVKLVKKVKKDELLSQIELQPCRVKGYHKH